MSDLEKIQQAQAVILEIFQANPDLRYTFLERNAMFLRDVLNLNYEKPEECLRGAKLAEQLMQINYGILK